MVPTTKRFAIALLGILAACTPSPEARQAQPAPSDAPPTSSTQSEQAADAPPKEGQHVVFQGMVRPTKGGYEVHGVIVDGGDLQKALASAPGRDPKNSDWFLGAVVRIEGELHKHEAHPEQDPDGPVMQTRSGTWMQARRIDSASIVKPAEIIEGTLARSKGMFSLAGRLINREDLDWSLAPNGARDGDRVRLHGQSRTVICEPNAQCLVEGSLPLFDIGRAERLP
jgi:hypothetical protein